MSQKRAPSEFLKQITGRPVVVKLNSGVDYRGKILIMKRLLIEIWNSANGEVTGQLH